MAGPFPFADVILRLRNAVPALRFVGNAADLEAALEQPPATMPAAYVVGVESGKEPKGASGGVQIQEIRAFVTVVVMVRNFAGNTQDGGARQEMDALVASIDGSLKNWKVAIGFVPLWMSTGRDEKLKGGVLAHQRVYVSSYGSRINLPA
ncbi:MAG: hypothetical protein ABI843_09735 [Dokdonella sp.]